MTTVELPSRRDWREVLVATPGSEVQATWLGELDYLLTPENVALRRTTTRRDVLAHVESGGIDLAVLSADTAGNRGLRTLEMVRSITPELPCILVTADTSASTLQRALELQAYSVFREPVDSKQLATLLMKILRQQLS